MIPHSKCAYDNEGLFYININEHHIIV